MGDMRVRDWWHVGKGAVTCGEGIVDMWVREWVTFGEGMSDMWGMGDWVTFGEGIGDMRGREWVTG